jgi:GT2 family glycosyltransferase
MMMENSKDYFPKVVICIVNWNGKHHLEYAIPSIVGTRYPNLAIVLVDNASKDQSVEYVCNNFPQIKVIQNESNLMWAGGNNVGIRFALEEGADWIMLANNDILVEPRWAELGMIVAERDSSIGIIGYNVIGESEKADVSLWHLACHNFEELTFADARGIAGCFMMVNSQVFRSIGLIDEAYNLYGEDNDLEARAVKAGFRTVRCNLPIWHCSEGTSEKVPLFSAYMATRNGLRYSIKQFGMNNFGIIRWLYNSLLNAICLKQTKSTNSGSGRRSRPSKNVLVNVRLVMHAFFWNLLHLRETRNAGRKDAELCLSVKQKNNP